MRARIGVCVGSLVLATQAQAQSSNSQFSQIDHEDVAAELLQRSVAATSLPTQQYMREVFWGFPETTPAFFRDSLVQVVARTYDLTRDNFDGTRTQGWAAGGWLAYRSGLIADTFGVHAAFYTSQPIFAPLDEPGSRLLTPNQDPINVLGQVYGRIKMGDQEFRGGRLLVDTPLINPQDNRMVPNTFQGTIVTTLPDSKRWYDYSVGYLWDIKQRDSNDFISMSDALVGGDVRNQGVPYGMLKLRPAPGFTAIIQDYDLKDYINTGFAQGEYAFQLPKDVPQWIVGANVIGQESIGENLLSGSPFQTYQASGRLQMSYAGFIVFAAGSITGDEFKLFSPYGSKPNYTDMQQVSFDNASEKAVGGSVAYDFGYAFGKQGLSGLTTGAWFTQGWGAINPATNAAIADRSELDLWIQYRPSIEPLKGLRVKIQYSDAWQRGNVRTVQPEFRAIVDYTLLVR